jgi:hypothetical protein
VYRSWTFAATVAAQLLACRRDSAAPGQANLQARGDLEIQVDSQLATRIWCATAVVHFTVRNTSQRTLHVAGHAAGAEGRLERREGEAWVPERSACDGDRAVFPIALARGTIMRGVLRAPQSGTYRLAVTYDEDGPRPATPVAYSAPFDTP